jgi:hypothetical protein
MKVKDRILTHLTQYLLRWSIVTRRHDFARSEATRYQKGTYYWIKAQNDLEKARGKRAACKLKIEKLMLYALRSRIDDDGDETMKLT